MKKKKESFFWTSYSDLMTSLFFIMLVLFVLVIVAMHSHIVATDSELREIKKAQNSTRDLSKDYFEYNEQHKKYILKVNCFFQELHTDVNELDENTLASLNAAGQEIKSFLDNHNDNKYILVIEGQASRNSELWTDRNYILSFQRAYSLMKYWKDVCNINFGSNCEFQIAGSGDGQYNVESMRSDNEVANQRFLIHIIPKNIIKE